MPGTVSAQGFRPPDNKRNAMNKIILFIKGEGGHATVARTTVCGPSTWYASI